MHYSRRTFLRIGTLTLPALNFGSAELLSSSAQTKDPKSRLEQAHRRYQRDLRVYAAKASGQAADNLKQWIDKASPADIWRADWARYEVQDSADKLQQAKSYKTQKESELAALKPKDDSRFSPTFRGESAAERRAAIKAAENNLNNANTWLAKANLDAEKAAKAFDNEFPRSPSGIFELFPTTINSNLQPDANPPDQLALFLCSLYTSNRGLGDGKPWRKPRLSSGTLSLSVKYTVPAQPDCHLTQREEEATALYDILAGNDEESHQITYGRAFTNLQVKPTGELTISVRLLDLSYTDDSFLNRAFSIGKKVWPMAKPFVNAFGGVGAITQFVDQVETVALAKPKTEVVWERHLSSQNPIVLSITGEGGTHILRRGYYVFADKEPSLDKYVLDVRQDGFKIYDKDGHPPSSNYLVFGICNA